MANKTYNNNYKNNNYNNNDSLKRSHSKYSNFKLTLLCLISSFSLTVGISALAIYPNYQKLSIYVMIPAFLLFIITLTWFKSFKR